MEHSKGYVMRVSKCIKFLVNTLGQHEIMISYFKRSRFIARVSLFFTKRKNVKWNYGFILGRVETDPI